MDVSDYLGRKISVALIGGAFDPIHSGHYEIAEYLLNETGLFDEVWFTPCYTHLYGKEMAPAHLRLAMCEEYAREDKRIKVCDYEIVHKLGGETYYFLNKFLSESDIKDKFRFSYVIGMDNANAFDKWMNFEYLKNLIPFIVIHRQGVKCNERSDWYLKEPHRFFNAGEQISELSSTYIRNFIRKSKDTFFKNPYHKGVADIIKNNKLYI